METAVSFIPFAIVCYGLIFFLYFAFLTLCLQFSVNEAARWGILGETLNDPFGQPLSREDSIRLRFEQAAQSYGIDPSDVDLRICPLNDPNCAVNNAGLPGQQILVQAEKPQLDLFGVGLVTPTASVSIKNENFE